MFCKQSKCGERARPGDQETRQIDHDDGSLPKDHCQIHAHPDHAPLGKPRHVVLTVPCRSLQAVHFRLEASLPSDCGWRRPAKVPIRFKRPNACYHYHYRDGVRLCGLTMKLKRTRARIFIEPAVVTTVVPPQLPWLNWLPPFCTPSGSTARPSLSMLQAERRCATLGQTTYACVCNNQCHIPPNDRTDSLSATKLQVGKIIFHIG